MLKGQEIGRVVPQTGFPEQSNNVVVTSSVVSRHRGSPVWKAWPAVRGELHRAPCASNAGYLLCFLTDYKRQPFNRLFSFLPTVAFK